MKQLKFMTVAAMVICISLTTFYGCKKTGIGEPDQPHTLKQEDLVAIYKAKLKDQPTSVTRYRNKQLSGNGGPCETTPGGTWITETWYISI